MAAKKSSGNASNKARANRCKSMPIRLERAIDIERRQLSKAQSVLGCLALALETPTTTGGPDFGEVAEVVRDLVNGSIERLDSVNLARVL
jgi:hypothetical protein